MTYTIFAGVNGAGKTSIYSLFDDKENLGIRINSDEIAQGIGDWRNEIVQLKAARIAVVKINECIADRVSFNQETTLSGTGIIQTMQKAKANGFVIKMYYVFVESLDTAKQRIRDRVAKGGHGIPEELIERRYMKSFDVLKKAINLCDSVTIYNNEVMFRSIADIKHGKLEYIDEETPHFMRKLIEESCLCTQSNK
ncbi:MAG: zeta toxin family protein [Oscillospiraceae bacterium]|nr:zeta toxin family protein [Oscillospiraceae bacterium]